MQVVSESLDAWDKGRRSIIPGRTIRWFIRATQPSPRALQLRITERIYRPKSYALASAINRPSARMWRSSVPQHPPITRSPEWAVCTDQRNSANSSGGVVSR